MHDTQSPVAYLRSRACWVIEYVSDLKWSQKETLPAILQVSDVSYYWYYYSLYCSCQYSFYFFIITITCNAMRAHFFCL